LLRTIIVEPHFSLVRLDVFRHQMSSRNSTVRIVRTPKIQPICEGECDCPDNLPCYLQHAVPTQKLHPVTHPSVFLLNPPLPTRFPTVVGHFSLETSPLKPDDAHLTTLSALIPSPRFRLDPPQPSRRRCAPPMARPQAKKADPLSLEALPRCNIHLSVVHYHEAKIWRSLLGMQVIRHRVYY
jgi:hypothetical protein